jgi:hypothetical protein
MSDTELKDGIEAGSGVGEADALVTGTESVDAGRSIPPVEAVRNFAGMVVDSAGKAGATVALAAGKLGSTAVEVAGDIYAAAGGETGKMAEGNCRKDDGTYVLPTPLIDGRESKELEILTDKYKRLIEPNFIEKTGKKLVGVIPQEAKEPFESILHGVTQQEFYKQAMSVVADGFKGIEQQVSKYTVSSEYVVGAVNDSGQKEKISNLREICLLRGYDAAKIANSQGSFHLALAFSEGAATGAPGFIGIPFNLVLSTFLYYRAVQSVAMFYGYDVKNDPAELVIAGEVFSNAMAPSQENNDGKTEIIGKVMLVSELAAVNQAVKKGWEAAAERGGVALLIVQMRALANGAARKALEKAGQEGLEASIFRSIFEQLGKSLSQKVVQRGIPVIGGVIGAFFDAGMMSRILTYANIFYEKRFILEKEARIEALSENMSFDEVIGTADA